MSTCAVSADIVTCQGNTTVSLTFKHNCGFNTPLRIWKPKGQWRLSPGKVWSSIVALFCRPSQPVQFYQGQQSLTGLIKIAVFEQRPSDGCAKPADRPVGSIRAGQGHQKQVWEQCCQHGKQLHTRHLNFNEKELSEKKYAFDVTFQITPGPLKLSQGHQNWYKSGQPDKQVPKTRITVCEKQPLSKAWPWMASVMEGQTLITTQTPMLFLATQKHLLK